MTEKLTFGVVEIAQSGSAHKYAVVVENLPDFKWYDGPGAMRDMATARNAARAEAERLNGLQEAASAGPSSGEGGEG